MLQIAFIWCFAGCFATAAGHFLLQRQAPVAPPGVSHGATGNPYVDTRVDKLMEEGNLVVLQQNNLLAQVVAGKQQEAQAAIEREIPLAASNDTAELAKEMAAQDARLLKAVDRSTRESREALEILKEKTENAVNMTAARTVRDVENEAAEQALHISNHTAQSILEADALAREASGAANFSVEAAQNSQLWVKELPVKDAAVAIHEARRSREESQQLRHEYEDIKRMAKLAGNMALSTIELAQKAVAKTNKASEEATLTLEQAGQNLMVLRTIRDTTKDASATAMGVIAR